MDEARDSEAWNHTASVMSVIANANRDDKRRPAPFTMEEFHPYLCGKKKAAGADVWRGPEASKAGFAALKTLVDGGALGRGE